ncbi:MAG: hypothetical protein MRZ79_19530 [Bacteroidia bacterium]|nr:hypothetical protein [Bacteroidia bacterium]
MKRIIISTLALIIILMASCTSEAQLSSMDEMKAKLQSLSGTYQDLQPYAYGDAFGQRVFTFEKGTWSLDFTLGLDSKLENKLFSFRTFGTYKVGEASKVVEGAFEALFLEEKKFLTLHATDSGLISAFGFTACGLTPGQETDISQSGCALWASVAACNEDHDLLSLDEDGGLRFGVRPADNNMCSPERRPTQLTPAVTKTK